MAVWRAIGVGLVVFGTCVVPTASGEDEGRAPVQSGMRAYIDPQTGRFVPEPVDPSQRPQAAPTRPPVWRPAGRQPRDQVRRAARRSRRDGRYDGQCISAASGRQSHDTRASNADRRLAAGAAPHRRRARRRGGDDHVINNDGAGEGFNDTTATAAVGGNPGDARAQRLNAFTYAANLWAAELTSAVTIKVDATIDNLSCNAQSACSARRAQSGYINFTNAPYEPICPQALANKIKGSDVSASNDIIAQFNGKIGTSGCLTSSGWYLGLDGNPTSGKIDFVAVVMHELGHGLGFQSWVDESTGQRTSNFDDVFMKFLEDHSTGKMWTAMTDAERKASAINSGNLHWTGSNVLAAATATSAPACRRPRRMYAPNPVESGSSVSHWDRLTPNQMMEPSYTSALHVTDLTRDAFTDIGWTSGRPRRPRPRRRPRPARRPVVDQHVVVHLASHVDVQHVVDQLEHRRPRL
jgi:hypothetical protein